MITQSDDLLKRFDVEGSAREAVFIVFGIGTNDSQYIKTTDNPQSKSGKI